MSKILIHKLFPVPVFEKKLDNHEELNKELEKYIYDLKKNDPKGQIKSNSGGWHSPFFDLSNKDNLGYKFLIKIQPHIVDVFNSYGHKN